MSQILVAQFQVSKEGFWEAIPSDKDVPYNDKRFRGKVVQLYAEVIK